MASKKQIKVPIGIKHDPDHGIVVTQWEYRDEQKPKKKGNQVPKQAKGKRK